MVLLDRLLSICLYHLDSSFLVLLTIGPAWCVTPIGPFMCNGTSLRYLTLKRLGFRQGRGIASAEMKFIFNDNKNKQRRRLRVSRNSRSGYLAAKLFSVNCAYFMK